MSQTESVSSLLPPEFQLVMPSIMQRGAAMKRIRTMIIDDSATVRQVLTQVLGNAPDIEVIATAADPLFAIRR